MAVRLSILVLQQSLCTFFLTAVCLGVAPSSWGASLSGQVFAVPSGERIVLFVEGAEYRSIKLHGIRSPAPERPAGRIARRHLHMLLAGKFVTVNYQSMTPQGEINGTVLHGGSDINLRMLETGLVRITGQAVPPEIPQSYRTAERRAQERHLGMWKQAQH